MKKKIFGLILIIALMILLLFLTGCGTEKITTNNETSTNSSVTSDYQQSTENQETVDLSEYEEYGSFKGEDYENQIAWVIKSDYNGRRYGYINRKGEFVIPLSSDIRYLTNTSNKLNDYENGKVVVSTLSQGIIIYDTKGEILAQYKDTSSAHKAKTLSNGNILITSQGKVYPDIYMYLNSSNEIVKLPIDVSISTDGNYSEGLLACKAEDNIIYLDEQGNIKLEIKPSDKSAYLGLDDGGDFKDGKATLGFFGQDRKHYEVTIDINGNWLDEPVFISEDTSYKN